MAKNQKTAGTAASKASRSKSASKAGRSNSASALTQKISSGKVSKSASKAAKSAAAVLTQKARSDQFVLGRKAFARISAVEGVVLSKSMEADLRRLDDASPAERRLVLHGKYGKA